jgi:hypothetical protein
MRTGTTRNAMIGCVGVFFATRRRAPPVRCALLPGHGTLRHLLAQGPLRETPREERPFFNFLEGDHLMRSNCLKTVTGPTTPIQGQ